MLAEQSLRDGDLSGALTQLQNQVKSDPAKFEYRVFLFQLLAVMGQWDRALTQLNVAGELDIEGLAMVQTYREVLRCEVLRKAVFNGERGPLIFGEPEPWIAGTINALGLSAANKVEEARNARLAAFESAPEVSGTIDGEAFEWIADADSRIGPFLEAVVNGNYYWLPFHRITKIKIEPPVDLRDLVWCPAQFMWANGGEAVGLIPSRYPGSEDSEDSTIQLSRSTQWQALGEDEYAGLGHRLLVTDSNEYSLLNIREINLNSPQEVESDSAEDGAVQDDAAGEAADGEAD